VENGIIYLADWNHFPELENVQKGQKVDIRVLKRKKLFWYSKEIRKNSSS